jgi:hypothetical protein
MANHLRFTFSDCGHQFNVTAQLHGFYQFFAVDSSLL